MLVKPEAKVQSMKRFQNEDGNAVLKREAKLSQSIRKGRRERMEFTRSIITLTLLLYILDTKKRVGTLVEGAVFLHRGVSLLEGEGEDLACR